MWIYPFCYRSGVVKETVSAYTHAQSEQDFVLLDQEKVQFIAMFETTQSSLFGEKSMIIIMDGYVIPYRFSRVVYL